MRPRPAPQTAAQAQECIAAIHAANGATKARRMISTFLLRHGQGLANWSPEAVTVWQEAAR